MALERDLEVTIHTRKQFDLTLNLQKSALVPSTRLEYLGMILDSASAKVFLPPVKLRKSREAIPSLLSCDLVVSQVIDAGAGSDGVLLRSNTICSGPHKTFATGDPCQMGQGSSIPGQSDLFESEVQGLPELVVQVPESSPRKTLPSNLLDGGNDRCLSDRLGRSAGHPECSKDLDVGRVQAPDQCSGTKSNQVEFVTLDGQPQRVFCPSPVRQHRGRGIYQSSGGHQECPGGSGGSQDPTRTT